MAAGWLLLVAQAGRASSTTARAHDSTMDAAAKEEAWAHHPAPRVYLPISRPSTTRTRASPDLSAG